MRTIPKLAAIAALAMANALPATASEDCAFIGRVAARIVNDRNAGISMSAELAAADAIGGGASVRAMVREIYNDPNARQLSAEGATHVYEAVCRSN